MNNNDVKIVVFDIGGVMIELASSWAAACEFAGIAERPGDITPELQEKLTLISIEVESGDISTHEYLHRMSILLGDQYSLDELQRIHGCIIQQELPGILEFVQELKGSGIRTACLSNTNALHWPILTDPAIYPAIVALDQRYASHLLGVCKPNLEIYRIIEEQEQVAPVDILFFDDRRENVNAALAAGWHAVQILPDTPSVQQLRFALELLTASAPRRPSPRG